MTHTEQKVTNNKRLIHNILKDLIYSGYSIKQIENMSQKLTSYLIISYLLEYSNNDLVILQAIKDYFYNLKILQQKCLVISDTHIGKLLDFEIPNEYNNPKTFYKNEDALYNAYNYAYKNNINSIIHLGDLIDGDPVHKSIIKPKEQVEYFKRVYPVVDGITTYLLYGNHDYNAIRFSDIKDAFAKECENINLVGVNYSFIYFNEYPIKLTHRKSVSKDIKHYYLPYDFELAGHRHIFNLDEENRQIHVPALASSLKDNSMIGFLEITNEEKEFIFKHFNQDANYLEEKKLTKKIKQQ